MRMILPKSLQYAGKKYIYKYVASNLIYGEGIGPVELYLFFTNLLFLFICICF
jgi:hypothetical protein